MTSRPPSEVLLGSTLEALQTLAPGVSAEYLGDAVHVRKGEKESRLAWTEDGIPYEGGTWVGLPLGDSGYPRVLFEIGSERSARMAAMTIRAIPSETRRTMICSATRAGAPCDEIWPDLDGTGLMRLLAAVRVFVHPADEWEEESPLARIVRCTGIPVVDHPGRPVRQPSDPGRTVEGWSGESFAEALQELWRSETTRTLPPPLARQLEEICADGG